MMGDEMEDALEPCGAEVACTFKPHIGSFNYDDSFQMDRCMEKSLE